MSVSIFTPKAFSSCSAILPDMSALLLSKLDRAGQGGKPEVRRQLPAAI